MSRTAQLCATPAAGLPPRPWIVSIDSTFDHQPAQDVAGAAPDRRPPRRASRSALWANTLPRMKAASPAAGGRLIVAFQPHLYSRTFAIESGAALDHGDEVVVLDVYVATEDPIPGFTRRPDRQCGALSPEGVHYVPKRGAVPTVLAGLPAQATSSSP